MISLVVTMRCDVAAQSICGIIPRLRLTLLTPPQLFRAGRCPRLAGLCGLPRAGEGLNLPHAEWGLPKPAAPFVPVTLSRGDHDPNNGGCCELFTGTLFKQHSARSPPLFRPVPEAPGCEQDSIV